MQFLVFHTRSVIGSNPIAGTSTAAILGLQLFFLAMKISLCYNKENLIINESLRLHHRIYKQKNHKEDFTVNKNEKIEVNALPIPDEELDAVAGGQEISEMPDDWQEGITPVGAITEA